MWRNFYSTPPQRAIALDELERVALQRLRILRVLAVSSSAERLFRSVEDLPEVARDTVGAFDLDDDLDTVAHYALRLAFCTDREKLDWLIDAECRLLILRLRGLPPQKTLKVLQHYGHYYRVHSTADVLSCISAAHATWLQQHHHTAIHFCCVPFHQVTNLVGRCLVLLDQGNCWVPVALMYHAAVYHFKVSLRAQFLALHRSLPSKRPEMDRLAQILDRIYADSMQIPQLPSALVLQRCNAPAVTLENIDTIAEKHFPLCMQHLHRKMRQNHHLKYDGRVQYRMFLKGLGFSVYNNILFFRNEFTKVIPPAKFDKEYVYHIRHSYGMEGARKDYAPMDCHQIITGGAPHHGQYHGCPFKHWDTSTLQQELRRTGVNHSQTESIARLAQHGQNQQACVALFDVLHHRAYRDSIGADEDGSHQMHPNQWVNASLKASP